MSGNVRRRRPSGPNENRDRTNAVSYVANYIFVLRRAAAPKAPLVIPTRGIETNNHQYGSALDECDIERDITASCQHPMCSNDARYK